MHIRHLGASILVVLLLAACGGSGPGATNAPGGTNLPGGGTVNPATAAPGGKVDCAAITTAAQQLLGVQLLAQLTTPDNVEAIKSKTMGNLDLDAFLAAMTQLHALDSVSSQFGDAKASIDAYAKAATAAKALFAMNPVTQAAVDAYVKDNVGTLPDFIARQTAITGAMATAGC